MRGKLLRDENLVEDGLLPIELKPWKAAPAGKVLFVLRNVLGTSVSPPLFFIILTFDIIWCTTLVSHVTSRALRAVRVVQKYACKCVPWIADNFTNRRCKIHTAHSGVHRL